MNKLKNEIETIRPLLEKKIHASWTLPKREYFDFLIKKMKTENILLIGLRQVGKTTLMEQLAYSFVFNDDKKKTNHKKEKISSSGESDVLYINLKLIDTNNIDNTSIISYISKSSSKLVLLDEIQLLSKWPDFLQVLIDLNKNKKFIVTGSNARELSRENIIGRIRTYFVKPLSFRDFKLIWKSSDMKKYFEGGSYPGKYKDIDPVLFYRSIVEEQVIDKISYDTPERINQDKFKNLSKYFVNVISNEVKIDKIPLKIISKPTARGYISHMEESRLIRKIAKYNDTSLHPLYKIYFEDQSMIYWFKNYNILNNNEVGSFIENLVFNCLDKLFNKSLGFNNIFYYKPSKEIDFIIPSEKLVIEVKHVKKLDPNSLADNLNEILSKDLMDYKKVVITKDIDKKVNGWEFISLTKFIKGVNHGL